MFNNLQEVEAFFQERGTLGIKPGLDRMHKLLDSINNPEKKIKAIHIAGTNGKGSTLTYLKDALIENNYQVGVFTSPSLIGLTGHILIDDQAIKEEQFLALFNRLLPIIDQLDAEEMHPTEFEIITAIAFMYFEKVDIAIIEAGMGGREDTTNVINPLVSIITNIGMDHAYFLGDTLEKIAYQKAGIIKKNSPTILGNMDKEVLPVFLQEAKHNQSTVYGLNRDFFCSSITSNKNLQTFKWNSIDLELNFSIKMSGKHQIENAAVAVMGLYLLQQMGIGLNWEKVQSSLAKSIIPGRFEKVHDSPVIILDGAHNLKGMEAFLKTVEEEYSEKKKHLVFAGFRDKELGKMLELALPYFDTIYLTTFNHPRAEKISILQRKFESEKVYAISDWQTLVKTIVDKKEQEYYFFAGSLHFIGNVRSLILQFASQ